jgi:hypothetical protein
MTASVREYEPSDEEPILGLALRPREPVFASVAQMLGPELLRGDWHRRAPGGYPAGPIPASASRARMRADPCARLDWAP